jgi:hypothetical protein
MVPEKALFSAQFNTWRNGSFYTKRQKPEKKVEPGCNYVSMHGGIKCAHKILI